MVIVPLCTCENSDLATYHLPEGWQKMTESQRDYDTWVECAGCKKILKPFGTRRSSRPGFVWET